MSIFCACVSAHVVWRGFVLACVRRCSGNSAGAAAESGGAAADGRHGPVTRACPPRRDPCQFELPATVTNSLATGSIRAGTALNRHGLLAATWIAEASRAARWRTHSAAQAYRDRPRRPAAGERRQGAAAQQQPGGLFPGLKDG